MTNIDGIIASLRHGGDMNQAQLREIADELQAAIAAAVQAEQQRGDQRVLDERDACADMALMSTDTRANLAAAIRARKAPRKLTNGDIADAIQRAYNATHQPPNDTELQNVIQLRSAIAAAVLQEREACAKLVSYYTANGFGFDDVSLELTEKRDQQIAAAIRARSVNICKCGINEATEPHPCPYQSDVNNDETYLCTCCNDCAYECVQDI